MEENNKRKHIIRLSLVAMLVILVFTVFTAPLGALSPSDLPDTGEELVITSDDVLIIHEGETAELGGKLIVRGTGGVRPILQIENRGGFTINGSIECDNAEISLLNNGTLNMYGSRIENTESGTLNLQNNGEWNINDSVLSTLGANTNIDNNGEINAYNWSLIDKFNTTNIFSTGLMLLDECIFSAGTGGQINLANAGSIKLCQSGWEANDGGQFDINTLFGEIVFHKSYVRASGASHGQLSGINILNGNVTLNWSSFENVGANINYLNNGILNMYGSRIENTDGGALSLVNNGKWNINDSVLSTLGATTDITINGEINAYNWSLIDEFNSTNIFNTGSMLLDDSIFSAATDGQINLTNFGSIRLRQSEWEANDGGGQINLANAGSIKLCQSGWEANDGGQFDINTLFGEIVFHKSYVRASGWRSGIDILSGDMTLNWSSFENIGANLNIANAGTLNITNVSNIYTSSCGKTNLSNSGEFCGNGGLVTCECDNGEGSSGEVTIVNEGNITFHQTNLVANGSSSVIKLKNEGAIGNVNATVYGGGTIDINNTYGNIDNFNGESGGSSHGHPSELSVVMGGIIGNANFLVHPDGIIGMYFEPGSHGIVGNLNASLIGAGSRLCIEVSDGADATFRNSSIVSSCGAFSIENYGKLFMQNTAFYAECEDEDQREHVLFFNRGDALLNCTSLRAGAGGLIKLENEGALQMNELSGNSYSDGTICICNQAGQMNFDAFFGNSQGPNSEISIVIEDGEFTVENLNFNVNGGISGIYVESGEMHVGNLNGAVSNAGRLCIEVSDGADATFRNCNISCGNWLSSGVFSFENYGKLFMQNTSFYAQSMEGEREHVLFFNRGDALLNCISLTAATGGLIKLENEGALQMNNLMGNSYSDGTIRICNHAGQMNFHNFWGYLNGRSQMSIWNNDIFAVSEEFNISYETGTFDIYPLEQGVVYTLFANGEMLLNHQAYEPSNPNPGDQAEDVAYDAVSLSWQGGDPDGDPVTYDLYFGTVEEGECNLPESPTASGLTQTNYSVSDLAPSTTYCWKVVAHENEVCALRGAIWTFATVSAVVPQPELNCTCGDICVNTTGWWRDGDVFNPRLKPLWAAVNSSAVGETICVKDGTYNENVDVTKSHLTIRSENGSANCIVQAASSNDHVFEVTEAYVNLSGFNVTGATGAYTAGIYLGSGVTHCNISDNTASNNTFGIHLWESSTNTLRNNTAFDNDDSGIQLSYYSSYNSLLDNTAFDNGGSGIGLWNHSSYNMLSNNTASDNEIGIQLSLLSNNNTLQNNIAFNNNISDEDEDGIGISISSSSYNDIEGGNVYYNDIGISIESGMPGSYNNVTGVNVTGNSIGLELMGEDNCTIANNVIWNNTEEGIYLDFSHRNNISGNTITGNDRGIYLRSSCNNEIINNNVSYNTVNGVELGSMEPPNSYNNISNNIIDHNGHYGIYFHYYEAYNTIFNNTISNNTRGIFIENADNNNITDNVIVNNQQYGIYLTSSDSNTIYNNYFNNTNNAGDDGNNVWNVTKRAGTSIISGPYLGGNYWSDYAGNDSTGDGLGDNLLPYKSSENIANGGDWHPLVSVKLCGDVAPYPDCDGIVDMGDVVLLLNHVGYPGNSTYALCNDWSGDCRCNGIINMGDVILLLNNVSYQGDTKYALACC